MLPEILAGSYTRYKEDTNVFTTWLSQAAVACGYKPAQREQHKPKPAHQQTLAANPRLKGKARKEAKAAAAAAGSKKIQDDYEAPQPTVKYKVTTQELLNQAEAVAKSEKAGVKVPDSVVRIIQRAIDARKRCASWFQKTGIVSEEDSTKSHLHFVTTLERALSTLRPDIPEIASPEKGPDPTTAVPAEELKNRFSVLGLEETVDDEDLTAAEAATELGGAKKRPGKDSIVEIYELEDRVDIEHAFIIFCFFEDLHRIQSFIQEIWKEYKTNKCDLTVASVTTNLAFNLVRRAEDELIANLDP